MNKRIVRIPEISVGDTCGYSMIEYHTDFTETINKLLKSNNINYRLCSMSYGATESTNDWRILFELKNEKKI